MRWDTVGAPPAWEEGDTRSGSSAPSGRSFTLPVAHPCGVRVVIDIDKSLPDFRDLAFRIADRVKLEPVP